MTNREKLLLGLGALAGVAAGYWINSDKGRDLTQQTTEELEKAATKVIDKGQEQLQNMSGKARDAVQYFKEQGDRKIERTQEQLAMGLREAREEIDRLTQQLENHLN